MKKTNFAVYLNKFLTHYLVNVRGCSSKTIDSYRYAFIHFINYMNKIKKMDTNKIEINHLTYECIVDFLEYLEKDRGNATSSRNQRQAAINSFVKYLTYEFPEYLSEYQKILSIPIKKQMQKDPLYLKEEQMKMVVQEIDLDKKDGLRDFLIFNLLYTTGIRVSELTNIKVRDLSLTEPYTLLVHGKGNKNRYVPLLKTSIEYIKKYITAMGYDRSEKECCWFFVNHSYQQFTRQGINYIVDKYFKSAQKKDPKMMKGTLTPHMIRHSIAMELVSSGVNLIYIRDLFGHESITTTEWYARANAEEKRRAIEEASKRLIPEEIAEWENNDDLMEWLKLLSSRPD